MALAAIVVVALVLTGEPEDQNLRTMLNFAVQPAAILLPVVGILLVTTAMITGVAFGSVLLASAPAIVVYFALPLAWSAAGTLSFLEGAAGRLDASGTLSFMGERLLDGNESARAGARLALWMLLPLALGAWRIVRGEVRAS